MAGSLFLAVDFDHETQSLLAQLLAPLAAAGRLPGRLSPPENWHITVRFLGHIDEVATDRLMAELDQTKWPGASGGSFKLKLSGFGALPQPKKATVLWVGVGSKSLSAVAQVADEAAVGIGLALEERSYRPHLTCPESGRLSASKASSNTTGVS